MAEALVALVVIALLGWGINEVMELRADVREADWQRREDLSFTQRLWVEIFGSIADLKDADDAWDTYTFNPDGGMRQRLAVVEARQRYLDEEAAYDEEEFASELEEHPVDYPAIHDRDEYHAGFYETSGDGADLDPPLDED